MRLVIASVVLLGLSLAACGTTGTSMPPAPLDPCPVSAVAPGETAPVGPQLTPAQQLAVDRGVIAALGAELAAAYVQWRDVDYPAWARRQAARVTVTSDWCAARS